MTAKICLVTGASSGIGLATALELLRAGHTVYGAARRTERMEPIRAAGGHTLAMDVTNDSDLGRVVHTITDTEQRIDVLVNNAGVALYGAAEDVPIDQARQAFEVNVFGIARLTQLVLPYMRGQGSGTIVNISSIGGVISLPLGGWYHATKHALEGYTDSLRQEVKRFGVRVVLIQPGLVASEFQDGTPEQLRTFSGQGAYRDVAETMAKRTAEFNSGSVSDPAVVAVAVRKAVESAKPKARYAVGKLARPLLFLDWLLPDGAWDAIATGGNKRTEAAGV